VSLRFAVLEIIKASIFWFGAEAQLRFLQVGDKLICVWKPAIR